MIQVYYFKMVENETYNPRYLKLFHFRGTPCIYVCSFESPVLMFNLDKRYVINTIYACV